MKAVAIPILATLALGANANSWPVKRLTSTGSSIDETITGVPPSFDCAMRKLAYKYGKQQIPRMEKFESLYYALDLNNPNCTVPLASNNNKNDTPNVEVPIKELSTINIDGAILVSPGESIQDAVDKATSTNNKDTNPTVLLRQGTHYLLDQLILGPEHSGLTLASYPGEKAIVSGGQSLSVEWKSYDTTNNKNIWVADVTGQAENIVGLQIDGKRATRARYPNIPGGIETSCGYGCMVPSADADWTPPNFNKYGKVDFYTDEVPLHDRNDTANEWFHHYMIGINGLCSVYEPPVSYWCSANTSGGGAFAFRTPSGITPKSNALPNLNKWKNPSDAEWFVWRPARWANWMFDTGAVNGTNFTFGKGGNQGARGNNQGGDFFVENIFEELDYPGEFYHDKRNKKLYLYHNGTGAPPTSNVITPQQKVLVNMTGTQWNPVKNIHLRDTTYTSASATYMERHGVPSAGDWALDRFGAIFFQGTENAVIDTCVFDRLDGNAVMISGYNRNATVQNSDFSFLGGNAIASWVC
jgi:hypothetical protein